jgi:hypothetical protein
MNLSSTDIKFLSRKALAHNLTNRGKTTDSTIHEIKTVIDVSKYSSFSFILHMPPSWHKCELLMKVGVLSSCSSHS